MKSIKSKTKLIRLKQRTTKKSENRRLFIDARTFDLFQTFDPHDCVLPGSVPSLQL